MQHSIGEGTDPALLGQFLVSGGHITVEDLATALSAQRAQKRTIGAAALAGGWINQQGVDQVLLYQWEHNVTFGQAAIALGLLSEPVVETLLLEQQGNRTPIGETLVLQGVLSQSRMEELLALFRDRRKDKRSLPAILRRTRVFSRLTEEELANLAAISEYSEFPGHVTVYRQGQVPDAFYIVESGAVKLEVYESGEISELGCLIPGEMIGLEAMISCSPYAESVQTVLRTTLLRFDWRRLHKLILESPGLATALLAEVSRTWKRQINPASIPQRFRALALFLPSVHRDRLTDSLIRAWEIQAKGNAAVISTAGLPGSTPSVQLHDSQRLTYFTFPSDVEETTLLEFLEANVSRLDRYEEILFLIDDRFKDLGRYLHQLSSRCVVLAGQAPVEFKLRQGRDRIFLLGDGGDQAVERWKNLHEAYPDVLSANQLRIDTAGWASSLMRHLRGNTIGLALGGGGARGMAHIGVLEVFEERGWSIDAIAGSSAGCAVAGIYALNRNVAQVRALWETYAIHPKRHPFSDYDFLRRRSLIKGRKFRSLLDRTIGQKHVSQTSLAFLPVAAELATGHQAVLSNASLADAIEASAAAPGLLPPVWIADGFYCDGGLVNNVPASVLRDYGMDVVISVNVSADPAAAPFRTDSIASMLSRGLDILMANGMKLQQTAADLEILPDVSRFAIMDYRSGHSIIQAGRDAAIAAANRIEEVYKSSR